MWSDGHSDDNEDVYNKSAFSSCHNWRKITGVSLQVIFSY